MTEDLSTDPAESPTQVSIFNPAEHDVAEELNAVNLDEVRPIDALSLIEKWQKRLKG